MACRLLPMYNTAKAVGLGRPNISDDVRLIQALFQSLCEVNDPMMAGITPVPVSGSFTPALSSLIVNYQTALKRKDPRIVVDGVVDPLPSRSGVEGDWDISFSGGADSTLSAMAYRLFRLSKNIYFNVGDRLNLPWRPNPTKYA